MSQVVLRRKAWDERRFDDCFKEGGAWCAARCPPAALRMPVQLPIQKGRLEAERVVVYIAPCVPCSEVGTCKYVEITSAVCWSCRGSPLFQAACMIWPWMRYSTVA